MTPGLLWGFLAFAFAFFAGLWYVGKKVSEKAYRYIMAFFIMFGATDHTLTMITAAPDDVIATSKFFVFVALLWWCIGIGCFVEALRVKNWRVTTAGKSFVDS